MISKLQRKFIMISVLSFLSVFTVMFSTILLFTFHQATVSSDRIADIIAENGEAFPPFDPGRLPQGAGDLPEGWIGPEAPFTTRFFVIRFDEGGRLQSANTSSIASVSGSEAEQYGYAALKEGDERGWLDEYRYKAVRTDTGTSVIFINNAAYRNTTRLIMLSALVILLCGGVIFLAVVVILSRRAVRPVAESYEKQKQFVTNANHELKTPLTLMMANLDIIEEELGKNEWLDDVRHEGREMEKLINRLVYLARMDESSSSPDTAEVSLSEMAGEMAALFQPAARQKGLTLLADIAPGVSVPGSEEELRQLLSALMENALKYCDAGGEISISLQGGASPLLRVENSFEAVEELDISSLFDRFYRDDRARTSGSGFGIGLSVAKAVADNHGAEIRAEKPRDGGIRFCVRFSAKARQRRRKRRRS